MRKDMTGVTMIELLIVLLILSISFGLAMPGFKGIMARNQVATQTNEVLLAINLARSEAGRIGKTVSVQAADPSDGGNEFGPGFCVVEGNPGDCSGTVIRRFDAMAEDTTLNSLEDVASLQFGPLGTLVNTASATRSLDLCYPGTSGRRIFITLIGRTKSYKADDPDASKHPEC